MLPAIRRRPLTIQFESPVLCSLPMNRKQSPVSNGDSPSSTLAWSRLLESNRRAVGATSRLWLCDSLRVHSRVPKAGALESRAAAEPSEESWETVSCLPCSVTSFYSSPHARRRAPECFSILAPGWLPNRWGAAGIWKSVFDAIRYTRT